MFYYSADVDCSRRTVPDGVLGHDHEREVERGPVQALPAQPETAVLAETFQIQQSFRWRRVPERGRPVRVSRGSLRQNLPATAASRLEKRVQHGQVGRRRRRKVARETSR